MKEKLEALLREGAEKIQNAKTEAELQEVKGYLLGKQGAVTELLKEIPKLDVSLRPEMGKAVNNVKNLLSEQIEGRREEIKLKADAIPEDFDFNAMQSLTMEARQKLTRIRPSSIGEASRIPGVSPADINVLLVYFGR